MIELKLSDVAETALIPLSNRASESKRRKPRVYDQKAVDIMNMLKIDTKKYDKLVTHECVIARTVMLDDAVRTYIKKYPHSVCINIGCGFDDRFSRIDNGRLVWFDIDLPDSIALRKKIFSDSDRRKMIAGNIVEYDWIRSVNSYLKSEPEHVVVIAEGLFMYLSKDEHQKILHILTDSFKTGVLIVELMNPCMMNERRHQTVRKTNAKFGWGTTSGKELELLEPRMHFISENSISTQLMRYTWISKIIGLICRNFNNRISVFTWG